MKYYQARYIGDEWELIRVRGILGHANVFMDNKKNQSRPAYSFEVEFLTLIRDALIYERIITDPARSTDWVVWTLGYPPVQSPPTIHSNHPCIQVIVTVDSLIPEDVEPIRKQYRFKYNPRTNQVEISDPLTAQAVGIPKGDAVARDRLRRDMKRRHYTTILKAPPFTQGLNRIDL